MTPDYPKNWLRISKREKDAAGWRCVRCGHDHEAPGPFNRKPCDKHCRIRYHPEAADFPHLVGLANERIEEEGGKWHWQMQRQRVLTVHHFDGDTTNNHPANLLALCQVCHLKLQSRVHPEAPAMSIEPWLLPHLSAWLEEFGDEQLHDAWSPALMAAQAKVAREESEAKA